MGRNERKYDFGLKWNKDTKILLPVCIGVLLLCFGICAMNVSYVANKFEDLLDVAIQNRSTLAAQVISDHIESDKDVVRSMSDQILLNAGVSFGNEKRIHEVLSSILQKTNLDKILYVRDDGNIYSSEGQIEDMDISDLLKEVNEEDDYTLIKSTYDFEDGITYYCMIFPLIQNDQVEGYLMGFKSVERLFDGLDLDTYSDISELFVIDELGTVIAYSDRHDSLNAPAPETDNFYLEMLKYLAKDEDCDYVENQLRRSLLSSDETKTEVKLSVDSLTLYHNQLPAHKEWIFINAVYEDDINDMLRDIQLESSVTGLSMILLMVGFTILVWWYVNNEQRTIMQLAFEDPLTKAPNERFFTEKANAILKDYPDIAFCLCCYDIQNFRYLNESYGHLKADEILRRFVEISEKEFSKKREIYARTGADKFAALLVDDGRCEERMNRMEVQLADVAQNFGINYPIKIKCGFYEIKNHMESISAMIDKANLARKSVSSQAKDLMATYRDDLMESTRRREYIESKMENALLNGGFVPYLQPKWNMKTDEISAAEALVRWRMPDGSVIPPGEFISIFEKNGFIEKVDFYMLEEICKYIRRMLDEGRKVFPVSVNQSRYLLHDPNYTLNVQQILLKYKIPKGLVELEITETVFFQERDRMLEVMNELRNLNMELSIDDFGSGYSSLNLLRDMPFDVLKIDRDFLKETNGNDAGKFIMRKVVEMAEGLGVRVVCEGVETKEQVQMLLDIGCIYAQGFLYSKPIPLDEFIEKYNCKDE